MIGAGWGWRTGLAGSLTRWCGCRAGGGIACPSPQPRSPWQPAAAVVPCPPSPPPPARNPRCPSRNGSSCAVPRWMRFRYASHWPVIAGTLHLGMHHLDQLDAFLGGLQHLAVAHDVVALQQHLDDGRARGRRAQAGLLHGVGEFFLVERLARRLHGREQRGFGESLGRPRLLLERLHVHHVLRLALLQARRQRLRRLRRALLPALRRPRRAPSSPPAAPPSRVV